MYADNKVIASSHHVRTAPSGSYRGKRLTPFFKGPVLAYMKKVDDATDNPGAGPGDGWFKISEVGYENRKWAPTLSLIETPPGLTEVCLSSEVWGVDKLVRPSDAPTTCSTFVSLFF